MDRESLQARIELGLAELRAHFPRITACRAMLDEWQEGQDRRFALRLDIRWPEHQTLASGEAKDNPLAALRAALAAAERQLRRAPGRKRAER